MRFKSIGMLFLICGLSASIQAATPSQGAVKISGDVASGDIMVARNRSTLEASEINIVAAVPAETYPSTITVSGASADTNYNGTYTYSASKYGISPVWWKYYNGSSDLIIYGNGTTWFVRGTGSSSPYTPGPDVYTKTASGTLLPPKTLWYDVDGETNALDFAIAYTLADSIPSQIIATNSTLQVKNIDTEAISYSDALQLSSTYSQVQITSADGYEIVFKNGNNVATEISADYFGMYRPLLLTEDPPDSDPTWVGNVGYNDARYLQPSDISALEATVASWENPTNGITQGAADIRYVKQGGVLTDDLDADGYNVTGVGSFSASSVTSTAISMTMSNLLDVAKGVDSAGLLAFYDFDEKTGGSLDTIKDYSGNSANMTLTAPAYTTVSGGLMTMSTNACRASITLSASSDWTISIYANYEGSSPGQRIIVLTADILWQPTLNKIEGFGINPLMSGLTAGWHLLTITRTGSTIKLYWDETLKNTITYTQNLGAIYVGNNASYIGYFRGSYDWMSVWSRVLTTTEIAALHNGARPRNISRR